MLETPTGRLFFLVAAGAAGELPHLLYQMGWDDAELDLRCHGEGDYIFAPPSPPGLLGTAEWIRPPDDTRALPESAPAARHPRLRLPQQQPARRQRALARLLNRAALPRTCRRADDLAVAGPLVLRVP
ncbi:hypothetical protein ACU686_39100 [Yinghuangia aomiensis]